SRYVTSLRTGFVPRISGSSDSLVSHFEYQLAQSGSSPSVIRYTTWCVSAASCSSSLILFARSSTSASSRVDRQGPVSMGAMRVTGRVDQAGRSGVLRGAAGGGRSLDHRHLGHGLGGHLRKAPPRRLDLGQNGVPDALRLGHAAFGIG